MKKEPTEEKDEFDALIESSKPLDDRLGNSPDKIEKKTAAKKGGGKQTTLPFKPVNKKGTKTNKETDSDDDDEINFETLSPPRPPRTPRRAAAGKLTLSSVTIIVLQFL